MNTLFRQLKLTTLVVLFALSSNVFAISLDSAKAYGYVGEMPSGYLGLVDPNAPTAVKALVDEVNEKRKATYQDIAKRNKATLSSVEKIAGKKAIAKTDPGHFVQKNGQWLKK